MTHDEFVSEIQKLTLSYRDRVAEEILTSVSATLSDAPPPPKSRPSKPKPAPATTSTVRMPVAEAKKSVEQMAKAEGMVVRSASVISEGTDTTQTPKAKAALKGLDIRGLSTVLLNRVRKTPGIGPGRLSLDTGIPSTTVRDHLKKLVAAKLIVKETTRSKFGHGAGYSAR
jgi:hypothetical protein